jgi:hypothetical protein
VSTHETRTVEESRDGNRPNLFTSNVFKSHFQITNPLLLEVLPTLGSSRLPAFQNNTSVPLSKIKKSKKGITLPVIMGLILCSETSATKYKLRLFQKSVKGKAFPIQALGFQEVEAPEFLDNRHMKVVRLSALRTGRLYPQKDSWYSFLLEAEFTPGPQCDRKD